jgi:hypothetical protein
VIDGAARILPTSERAAFREEWLGELDAIEKASTGGFLQAIEPIRFAIGQRTTAVFVRDTHCQVGRRPAPQAANVLAAASLVPTWRW